MRENVEASTENKNKSVVGDCDGLTHFWLMAELKMETKMGTTMEMEMQMEQLGEDADDKWRVLRLRRSWSWPGSVPSET